MWMTLIGMIPGLASLANTLVGKYFDTKVQLTMARLNCDRAAAEVFVNGAVQQDATNEKRLGVFASNKLLTFLLVGFALPILVWFFKSVAIDKVWCPYWYGEACTTDALAGEVLEITHTVIYFLFGAPAALGVAKLFWGRDKTGE